MKKLFIKQPAGLGDICFLQKLATQEQEKYGYEVWWPVVPVYSHLSQYITNFNYPSIEDDFPFKEAYTQSPLNSQTETEDFKIISTDGADGPNARALLTYSQSGDPTSEHFTDQTWLFSRKEWRPVLFRDDDINSDPNLETYRVSARQTQERQ